MKYRKKPVVIEAVQWNGHNFADICKFMNCVPDVCAKELCNGKPSIILIQTLEGVMEASVYDYIIKGVNGEFYPCKPDIFAKTYELVEE